MSFQKSERWILLKTQGNFPKILHRSVKIACSQQVSITRYGARKLAPQGGWMRFGATIWMQKSWILEIFREKMRILRRVSLDAHLGASRSNQIWYICWKFGGVAIRTDQFLFHRRAKKPIWGIEFRAASLLFLLLLFVKNEHSLGNPRLKNYGVLRVV